MASGYILMFISIALIRMRYPFELEWIEGAFVDEARWIMDGKFPYVAPTISFMPSIYTPLYYYTAALFMKIIGVGFFAPRLVSVLATVGCFILLYSLVAKVSGYPEAGILAAGLYAASYSFSGAWMDLAKTDSLYLFFLLLAFWVGCRFPKIPALLSISGALFVLAVFTKQIALPVALAVILITFITTRGQSWPQLISFGILGAVAYLVLEKYSSGWFSFYVIWLPLYHPRTLNLWVLGKSLLLSFWPSVLLALVYTSSVIWEARQHRWKFTEESWQYLGFGYASILASWSIFHKAWTYLNGYMPACLGLALLAALGFGQLLKFVRNRCSSKKLALATISFSSILIIIQFVLLIYNPVDQLPTKSYLSNAQENIRALRDLPGNVWVLSHGFMSYQAGRPTYLHSAALGDVGGSKPPPGTEVFRRWRTAREVFQQVFEEQQFQWIIIDGHTNIGKPYYVEVKELPYEFYPVTGAKTRPRYLMTKNPVAKGGMFPLTDSLFDVLFTQGWGSQESWGRWANATRAEVQVTLESDHDYQAEIQVSPICQENQPAIQEIAVGWNDENLGALQIRDCTVQTINLLIPATIISKDANQLWFEFKPNSATKSTELIQGGKNMIGFRSIKFTQK
jgi:hypothetical protein